MTSSGGGAFLSILGAGLAGAIATFCWKHADVPVRNRLNRVLSNAQITLSGKPVIEGRVIGLYTLFAATFACAFFTS